MNFTAAYIRHKLTGYDDLLNYKGYDKKSARRAVYPIVVEYMKLWRRDPNPRPYNPFDLGLNR